MHDNELVNSIRGEKAYTYVPVEGWYIVKVERSVFTAHWDSGFPDEAAFLITLWNGENERIAKVFGGNEYTTTAPYNLLYEAVIPVVTEQSEIMESWEGYRNAVRFISWILEVAGNACSHSDGIVRVVKGRKVPKGVYKVLYSGTGQYGPYVDLEVNGKRVNFVSEDNVELVPNYERCYRGCEGESFLIAIAKSEFKDKNAWLAFIDWCRDSEYKDEMTSKYLFKLIESRTFASFRETNKQVSWHMSSDTVTF